MNVSGLENVEKNSVVLSLFKESAAQEILIQDPLETLIQEAEIESPAMETAEAARLVVSEELFPDQSIYILEQQLKSLRSSMNRMKFYLEGVDDLLP